MNTIVVSKEIKRNILGYLILCWLIGLSSAAQATEGTGVREEENEAPLSQNHLILRSAAFASFGTLVGYSCWLISVYNSRLPVYETRTVKNIDESQSQLKKTIYYKTGHYGIAGAAVGTGIGVVCCSALTMFMCTNPISAPIVAAATLAKVPLFFGGVAAGNAIGSDFEGSTQPPDISYIPYDQKLENIGTDFSDKRYKKITYEPIYGYKKVEKRVEKPVSFDSSDLFPKNMKLAGTIGLLIFSTLFSAGYALGHRHRTATRCEEIEEDDAQ